MTNDQTSVELANLAQKKDEDLYTYYCWTERLLKEIHGQDQVTNNGREAVTFSLPEQQLLKDTIMKFILDFKNFDLQFYIVEYRTNPTLSLYGAYKFAKFALAILHIQAQMQDNWKQQQRYEASKSCQASSQNGICLYSYTCNPPPRQTQSVKPKFMYQDEKKFHCNTYPSAYKLNFSIFNQAQSCQIFVKYCPRKTLARIYPNPALEKVLQASPNKRDNEARQDGLKDAICCDENV